MAETVIVTGNDDQGDGTASPEFAAGVAAATAVTAAATAAEAENTAEVAEAEAGAAVEMAASAQAAAVDAEVTAEVALAAVADLEERVMEALGDVSAALTDLAEGSDGGPEPDVVVSGEGNTVQVDASQEDDGDEKPKSSKKKRQPFWTSRLS